MLPDILLDEIVVRALAEDLAAGDLTTAATVPPQTRAVGRALARSRLVVCGTAVFARVFYAVDSGLRVEGRVSDGVVVQPDTLLWLVEGDAKSILKAERTALNFIQRMSGVATLTRSYVSALPAGSRMRVTDTRKTMPGLRVLDRYAVRVGGAHNHRDSLGAGLLIKDNHIEAAGGIQPAVERARQHAPHTVRLEVEVESLAALDQALAAGADIVMLDNFAPDQLREAVTRSRGRALVEVSGRISHERLTELAELGVDIVSVGALTHSAPAADIALDIERLGDG
ncbi:carboxylating nicotinate-nucleotide diphosphorylase [Myxococcota bacterium]